MSSQSLSHFLLALGIVPRGITSRCTCYPFVNDSSEISVGNSWVTLFPACCLPAISVHPCSSESHIPRLCFPLVKWLRWKVHLPQLESWKSDEWLAGSRTTLGSGHFSLQRVIITLSSIVCNGENGLISTCGRRCMSAIAFIVWGCSLRDLR